jgi:hypothetical protein
MINRITFTLLCFLAPLLAGADPLDVYGKLIGKTVLMSARLPALPDSITSGLPPDKTNAIARIEEALAEQDLKVVQDGPHFVRVFPKAAPSSFTNAPLRGTALAAAKGREEMPPGMLNLGGADTQQVLSLYAALTQRTILRSTSLPAPTIRLISQCPLSQAECVYALATVFALNGITIVEDGDRFVQVVPVPQQAETRAPKREPDAMLFDPKKVPSMGSPNRPGPPSPPPRPLTEVERIERQFEQLRKAFYDFLQPPEPRKPAGRRLFELYARLADKTAVPSPKFDGVGIWFQVETPLSKGELLYAIETTFALNNLAIIPVDDHKIRLGHISEVLKSNGKQLEHVQMKR